MAPHTFEYPVEWAGTGEDGQPWPENWGTGATSAPASRKLMKARPTPSAATRRASSASPRRSAGTAAELDLQQLTAGPVTRALLAQVRHPGRPLSPAGERIYLAAGRSLTRS